MSQPVVPFLAALSDAAESAGAAETAFRREAAERIRALEQARAFAFRRLNVMRAVADAIANAENEEIAVAGALAVLRAKVGWSSDSESRSAVVSHFAPVARAVFLSLREPAEAAAEDVQARLREFEAWYAETYRVYFWSLLEQPMPDTPVVDF